MNDFDQLLEHKLRQMLDPVVAAPAPPRRRNKGAKRLVLVAEGPFGLAFVAVPAGEPVTVSVRSARQL